MKFSTKMYLCNIIIVLICVFLMGITNYLKMSNAVKKLAMSFVASSLDRVEEALEMQNEITQKQINSDLEVIDLMLKALGTPYLDKNEYIEMDIVNQITKEKEHVRIPVLKIGNMKINNNFKLVDAVQKKVGGTATIFQVLPGKLLRVSTNVRKLDGSRAVGTYIPSSSPVYKTVISGRTYHGRAFVVNAWYLTAYKPLRDPSGKIIAVIYVGRKILIPPLKKMLEKTNINGKGHLFVFNSQGKIIYHPISRIMGKNIKDFEFGKKLLNTKNDFVEYSFNGEKKIASIIYFEPYDWYIGCSINKSDIFFGMDKILLFSVGISGIIALIISVLIVVVLIKYINEPLKKIAAICDRIANGEYDAQVDYKANDTIGTIVKAIHNMAKNISDKIHIMESFKNGISLPLFEIDKNRIVQFANDAICKLTGHSKENVIGKLKGYEMLNYPSLDECQICKPIGERVIPTGEPWEGEASFCTKTGEEKIVLVNAFPIKDRNGEILQVAVILQDITEIKNNQKIIMEQTDTLKRIAQSITLITDNIASALEELSAQIEQTAQGAELQRERTESTATAMEQMNSAVLEIAKNASETAEDTESAKQKALEGEKIVHKAIDAIKEVQSLSKLLKENMDQLGQKANNIGNIINVITDIADQTNLLALNAAIEAARAGEHGRGFAVVADEVRKLAEKTMAATKEVEEAIAQIQQAIRKNIVDTEKATKAVEQATELASSSGEALREIVSISESNADKVGAIATAAEEQSASSEEIARTIEEIKNISAETSQGMEQASAAINQLVEQAQRLKQLVQEMQK